MSDLVTVHTGLDFGEGPRWHDGRLWFSDFHRHGVFTLADGVEERVVTVENRPSGLGWMPDGTLLIVSMVDRRVLRVADDGTLAEHADLSGIASWHCNDMVVGVDGTAYVGNFGFDLDAGADPIGASLARIEPDGTVHEAATDLLFPNGSVITPDGGTLVVGETFGGRYTAFTIADDGSLTDRRVWAEIPGHAPDGCALDADGGIWFADPVNHRVTRVIEGGEITHMVETADGAFACALGDDDRRTLYVITCAGSSDADTIGTGTGAISTMRVDAPGAGLP